MPYTFEKAAKFPVKICLPKLVCRRFFSNQKYLSKFLNQYFFIKAI